MAKKTMYSFEETRDSFNGIVATIMGAIGGLILPAMIYLSYYNRGYAGLYVGAFGLTGLLFSLVGFLIGLKSFSEKNIKYRYPRLGSILSGISFVLWIGILVMGA